MIPKNFGEWLWLILVVVIIPFVVGLLGVYAKPKLDLFWGKYSETQRRKNELQKKKLDEYVQRITQYRLKARISMPIRLKRQSIFTP